jgi:hypothetical protein
MLRLTDVDAKGLEDTGGHRDLPRPARVVAGEEGEHRSAERALGILGAKFEGVDGSGERKQLVLDYVRAAEAAEGRTLGGEVRVASGEGRLVGSGAETEVRRRWTVAGDR